MLSNEIWTANCLTNIGKFMKRRNLSFTEILNENTLVFFDHIEEKSYILILMSHEKIGVEILKSYIEKAMNKEIKNYIVIYQKNITSTCLKILNNFFEYNIELFCLDEFKFDITKVKYYTKHKKISEKEKKELNAIYQEKLPVILLSDPIVRYFGYKKNDILIIYRDNNEITYRMVR